MEHTYSWETVRGRGAGFLGGRAGPSQYSATAFPTQYRVAQLPLKFNPASYFDGYTRYSGTTYNSSSETLSEESRRRRRPPGWFFCCLCSSIIIIIAIVIGVAVYLVRDSASSEAIVGNTTPAAEQLIPITTTSAIIQVEAEIFNQTFIEEYNDATSPEYQALETQLCDEVALVYAAFNQTIENCNVTDVRSGSIIASLQFTAVDVTETTNAERIIPSLEQAAAKASTDVQTSLELLIPESTQYNTDTVNEQQSTTTWRVVESDGTETNFDACESHPCEQTCFTDYEQLTYTCDCYSGWVLQADGISCSELNECDSGPCQNGATCVDLEDAYECTCVSGWTGSNCETDIDDCAADPCLNGATCTDLLGGYECACATGYTGLTCDTNPDDCASVTCSNGGVCVDGLAEFTCECQAGWTGTLCESDIDECSEAVSEDCTMDGRGECDNTPGSWTCTCQFGYFGDDHCLYDYCPNRPECFALTPQSTTAATLYPYGSAAGDASVATDAGYETQPISTLGMFMFYDVTYEYVRISTNGIVWMDQTGYDVVITALNQCMTGTMHYRTDLGTDLLDSLTDDVCLLLNDALYSGLRESPCTFRATYAMVITWEGMAETSGATGGATFQLVLVSDTINSYGIYLYTNVEFSERVCDLATEENVGFINTVDSRAACCTLPYGDLGDLTGLPSRSNVGVPGMYVMAYNWLPGENVTLSEQP